ncbi:hypothetical protein GCM10028805_43170 [Spirosoma harenae]
MDLARAEQTNQSELASISLERIRHNLVALIATLGPGRISGQQIAFLSSVAHQVSSFSQVCGLLTELDELTQLDERLE